MKRTISVVFGDGNLNHNNRVFSTSNVDKNRTKDNVILRHETLEKTYQDLFGEALKEYNAKQKRKDRKIDNYLEHIKTSKNNQKAFHELIIQVGNMNDFSCENKNDVEIATKIYKEFLKDFEFQNPNFKVFNAVIHLDEKAPHMHVDFIPISKNNKRGLSVQNSMKGALKRHGFTQEEHQKTNGSWLLVERQRLKLSAEKFGLEIEELHTKRDDLSLKQYKALRYIEQERNKDALTHAVDTKRVIFNKKMLKLSTGDYERLIKDYGNAQRLIISQDKTIKDYENKNHFFKYQHRKIEDTVSRLEIAEKTIEQNSEVIKEQNSEIIDLKEDYSEIQDKYQNLQKKHSNLIKKYNEKTEENSKLKEVNSELKKENNFLTEELEIVRGFFVAIGQNIGAVFNDFKDFITQDKYLTRCFKSLGNYVANRLPKRHSDLSKTPEYTQGFEEEYEKTKPKEKSRSLGLGL